MIGQMICPKVPNQGPQNAGVHSHIATRKFRIDRTDTYVGEQGRDNGATRGPITVDFGGQIFSCFPEMSSRCYQRHTQRKIKRRNGLEVF
jgi:hypothetical protein